MEVCVCVCVCVLEVCGASVDVYCCVHASTFFQTLYIFQSIKGVCARVHVPDVLVCLCVCLCLLICV